MKVGFTVFVEGRQVPYMEAIKKFPFLPEKAVFLRKMISSISEICDSGTTSSVSESYRTNQGIRITLFCEVKN